MPNPYLIEGPALISFSGGRTSAYMLWHILDAYNGKLPDDIHVCFANTGKEREETLRFVHECATHWDVNIKWLEWRSRLKSIPASDRFEEVGYNSASRNGEPFEALIASKKFTPNQAMRFCTEHLKMQVCADYMEANGYERWNNVIGLRWDEQRRMLKQIEKNHEGKTSWWTLMPMARQATKVTKAMVMDFWSKQSFDLQLEGWQGNCDLCFLKGPRILKRIIRENPESAVWWDRMEKTIGKGAFSKEHSVSQLVKEVASSPLLPLGIGDEDEFDAECGLWCAENA